MFATAHEYGTAAGAAAHPQKSPFLATIDVTLTFSDQSTSTYPGLAIADWFSMGDVVSLSFRRIPAQDLTMSLAWGVYALVLLAVGVVRDVSGLRWVSLFILILTIGKVFLYDLGQLQDLFRVMSLLGLAVSLILVSLAYQRFVFRKVSSEER